jgi:hypothetical protein
MFRDLLNMLTVVDNRISPPLLNVQQFEQQYFSNTNDSDSLLSGNGPVANRLREHILVLNSLTILDSQKLKTLESEFNYHFNYGTEYNSDFVRTPEYKEYREGVHREFHSLTSLYVYLYVTRQVDTSSLKANFKVDTTKSHKAYFPSLNTEHEFLQRISKIQVVDRRVYLEHEAEDRVVSIEQNPYILEKVNTEIRDYIQKKIGLNLNTNFEESIEYYKVKFSKLVQDNFEFIQKYLYETSASETQGFKIAVTTREDYSNPGKKILVVNVDTMIKLSYDSVTCSATVNISQDTVGYHFDDRVLRNNYSKLAGCQAIKALFEYVETAVLKHQAALLENPKYDSESEADSES